MDNFSNHVLHQPHLRIFFLYFYLLDRNKTSTGTTNTKAHNVIFPPMKTLFHFFELQQFFNFPFWKSIVCDTHSWLYQRKSFSHDFCARHRKKEKVHKKYVFGYIFFFREDRVWVVYIHDPVYTRLFMYLSSCKCKFVRMMFNPIRCCKLPKLFIFYPTHIDVCPQSTS